MDEMKYYDVYDKRHPELRSTAIASTPKEAIRLQIQCELHGDYLGKYTNLKDLSAFIQGQLDYWSNLVAEEVSKSEIIDKSEDFHAD